jgi:hypothetical protein
MQPAIRKVEVKSAVRSLRVVVVDGFVQYRLEVTPATNDHQLNRDGIVASHRPPVG